MGSTEAEVDDVDTARGSDSTARCFGGERCLKGALVEQVGLDKLCLGDGRRNLEERLVREHDAPLRHRPHLTRETEGTKATQGVLGKANAREVLKVGLVEGKLLKEGEAVLETSCDEKASVPRQSSTKQTEGRGSSHLVAEVARRHVELVEVSD